MIDPADNLVFIYDFGKKWLVEGGGEFTAIFDEPGQANDMLGGMGQLITSPALTMQAADIRRLNIKYGTRLQHAGVAWIAQTPIPLGDGEFVSLPLNKG
ncbi:hypothetical protein V8J88_03860 [Massilia sp. W12]|uniref:head-tail joining protein n=1 Tax=Massilia sp. W12 TaxID=3126507 RepID=UPI0030CE13E0